MPAYIKDRIAADVGTLVTEPAFRARLMAAGAMPRTGTAAQYAAMIEEQRRQLAAIHQASGLKPAQ
jgi:tripartite-type tricarboxylate transporter receptor subunit TctC